MPEETSSFRLDSCYFFGLLTLTLFPFMALFAFMRCSYLRHCNWTWLLLQSQLIAA